MPTRTKKPRKKTKAELHDAIGENLHAASIRLEFLKTQGNKAQKEQAEKACLDLRRAHASFKALIGRK